MLNKSEMDAIIAIMVRGIQAHDDHEKASDALAKAREAVREADERISRFYQAMALFDFDVKTEGAWGRMKEILGEERYKLAFKLARLPVEREDSATLISNEDKTSSEAVTVPDSGPATQPEEDVVEAHPSDDEPNLGEDDRGGDDGKATVRERITAILANMPFKTATAADIRTSLEGQGLKLHDKTVGMTLYRMSKDGLVSRTGRNWRLVTEPNSADIFS